MQYRAQPPAWHTVLAARLEVLIHSLTLSLWLADTTQGIEKMEPAYRCLKYLCDDFICISDLNGFFRGLNLNIEQELPIFRQVKKAWHNTLAAPIPKHSKKLMRAIATIQREAYSMYPFVSHFPSFSRTTLFSLARELSSRRCFRAVAYGTVSVACH